MNDIYSPPQSNVQRDTADTGDVIYAGFWIRFVASIIDSLWLVALTLFLGWMVYGQYYLESEEFLLGYADFLISYVLPFILTLMFWAYKSATPGKMILGLKIVDADGYGKVTKGRLAGRYLGYYLSTLVLCLGFLWVAWDKRKQGWHDKLARTVVIKGN